MAYSVKAECLLASSVVCVQCLAEGAAVHWGRNASVVSHFLVGINLQNLNFFLSRFGHVDAA
jgi:hypothetical protein